jgi:hypothetical protein
MEQSTVHLEKLVDLLAQLITFTDVSSAGPRTPPQHDDAERPTTDAIMLAFLRAFSNERLCDQCLGHSIGKFDRDVAAGVSVLLTEGHVDRKRGRCARCARTAQVLALRAGMGLMSVAGVVQ